MYIKKNTLYLKEFNISKRTASNLVTHKGWGKNISRRKTPKGERHHMNIMKRYTIFRRDMKKKFQGRSKQHI